MLKFCVQMGDGQVYNIFENHPDRLEDVTGIIFSVQGALFRHLFYFLIVSVLRVATVS